MLYNWFYIVYFGGIEFYYLEEIKVYKNKIKIFINVIF